MNDSFEECIKTISPTNSPTNSPKKIKNNDQFHESRAWLNNIEIPTITFYFNIPEITYLQNFESDPTIKSFLEYRNKCLTKIYDLDYSLNQKVNNNYVVNTIKQIHDIYNTLYQFRFIGNDFIKKYNKLPDIIKIKELPPNLKLSDIYFNEDY